MLESLPTVNSILGINNEIKNEVNYGKCIKTIFLVRSPDWNQMAVRINGIPNTK